METVSEKFEELKELVSSLSEPQDRLEYFVELANQAILDPLEKQDCFLVPGCISRLWLVPQFSAGHCYFRCDGDAVIPKGVACALLNIFSGATPQELLNFEAEKLHELGLAELLGVNRRNAVTRLLAAIQRFAEAVLSEAELKSGAESNLEPLLAAMTA